ncbi:cytochrome c heme-lyase [Kwoniella heveanensis BCC8398]|uniref:Holocytochrome c-type synthase n=1 Tax=Kwoniella heveanensis BCC8398 TaxID=1296120 RepID=A0A1B9GX87_9TREE|nr:cytochrome c heme-lyase [Kwoniella heveanensis BCC8398]
MKWNIGSSSSASSSSASTLIDPTLATSAIPSDHPPIPASSSSSLAGARPPAQCPMHQSSGGPPRGAAAGGASSSSSGLAKCPIQHDGNGGPDKMNPLNNIPANLSLSKQPDQKLDLPTDRTASTIPRPKGDNPGGEAYGLGNTWDYPSPQQFYNALVRKGWETPEESVEVMVAIHNFLNERAWEEVMKWEKRLPGGENSQLARFTGRPGELSPKARFHLWAGKLFPETFNTEPPFDRHDWIVTRPVPTSTSTATSTPTPSSSSSTETPTPTPAAEAPTVSTRYVIDYYSAPPDEDGNPVFSLDVRPALDSFESFSERIKVSWEEWRNGNGSSESG